MIFAFHSRIELCWLEGSSEGLVLASAVVEVLWLWVVKVVGLVAVVAVADDRMLDAFALQLVLLVNSLQFRHQLSDEGLCVVPALSKKLLQLFYSLHVIRQVNQVINVHLLWHITFLTRVQPVQALVDPLLHVQSLLQLLPVVLDGNPGMSLRYRTPEILRQPQI